MVKIMLQSLFMCVLVAIVSLLSSPTAHAADYDHIKRTAKKVASKAKELHEEIDIHFKSNRTLHNHVKETEKLALHIEKLAKDGEKTDHMRDDLRKLHEQVRHIEEHAMRLVGPGSKHVREAVEELHNEVDHLKKDLE